MKKIYKLVALMLMLVMGVSVVGCQKSKPVVEEKKPTISTEATAEKPSTPEAPDTSEFVDLKLYFVGDKSNDRDKVMELINADLKEELNCTLSLEYISWGDFSTKYQLLFASNDDFDGIFAADWAFYGSQAQKNGFLEITEDLLAKYAPNVLANTPQEVWDQVKVNGKIYMVPQMVDEFNQRHFIVRGDLREKYGVPEIKTIQDLTPYLKAVYENEKDMTPFLMLPSDTYFMQSLTAQRYGWTQAGNVKVFTYPHFNITDPNNAEIFSLLDTPEYMQTLKTIREWNLAGYIPKSMLTNQLGMTDAVKNGKAAMAIHNPGTANNIFNDIRQNRPDWKVEVFDGTDGQKVLPYSAAGGGIGIHATTKHADRLLMVVDYLRYDKEANFLAQRGIKDTHWIAADASNENIVKAGPQNADYGDSFTWGPWRNSMYQVSPHPEDAIPGYTELIESLKSRTVSHPLLTFNFNDENVKNELAAVKGVIDQYGVPLEFGFVDPEEGLATYKEKLEAAGFNKIMDEMKTQAAAFVQEYNK